MKEKTSKERVARPGDRKENSESDKKNIERRPIQPAINGLGTSLNNTAIHEEPRSEGKKEKHKASKKA